MMIMRGMGWLKGSQRFQIKFNDFNVFRDFISGSLSCLLVVVVQSKVAPSCIEGTRHSPLRPLFAPDEDHIGPRVRLEVAVIGCEFTIEVIGTLSIEDLKVAIFPALNVRFVPLGRMEIRKPQSHVRHKIGFDFNLAEYVTKADA